MDELKFELKSDVFTLKSYVAINADKLEKDMKNNAKELKSDISNLKSDVATNAEKMNDLKSDMVTEIKASHDKIMNCVEAFDMRIKKVEKLTTAVPELVRTVDAKLSASSNELKEIGGKVNQEREKHHGAEDFCQTVERNEGRTTNVVFRFAASIQR